MTRQLRREERSRRGFAAAVDVARRHGLTVSEPTVLADLFSLMVHLRPAPVVARVATRMPKLRSPTEESLRAEIDVTTYLAGQGAPVVRPSDELPAGPHRQDGFAITYWTYLEADPDRTPTARDCSAMVVELHQVLKEHPGNVVATKNGLVWIDFEDVCLGPVEWDLASMMDAGAIGPAHRPRPEILARCKELRTLQVVLALVAFHEEFGDLDGWADSIRSMLGELA